MQTPKHNQTNRTTAGYATPAEVCPDCGGSRRCADTCPTARAFDARLHADLARLAARGGSPFTRPIATPEREFCDACGLPIARRDRRRFTVRVHFAGPDAVRRVVLFDGSPTGVELDDAPAMAGAR